MGWTVTAVNDRGKASKSALLMCLRLADCLLQALRQHGGDVKLTPPPTHFLQCCQLWIYGDAQSATHDMLLLPQQAEGQQNSSFHEPNNAAAASA
jgi:hypothetical protein